MMRASKPMQGAQNRTMVTETQLRARIKTVSNVRKITSTMKMVAASKLRHAQNVLTTARSFQKDVSGVWPESDVSEELEEKEGVLTICSDGGLCGAVNSAIVRMVRADTAPMVARDSKTELSMTLIGMKSIQGLERTHKDYYDTTITEAGKLKALTFRQATKLAEFLVDSGSDRTNVYFNIFRSAVAYDTTKVQFQPLEKAMGDGKFLLPYELEGGNDILENFYSFRAAVKMFHFISENDTSTLSSRMNAMENSSKNAGEMLDALTLQLNRSRQARITTELIEIISGAAAAEEMK